MKTRGEDCLLGEVNESGAMGGAGSAERGDPGGHRQLFAQSLYSAKRNPSIIPIGGVCAARLIGRRVSFPERSESANTAERFRAVS